MSANNGQAIFVDKRPRNTDHLKPFLAHLRALPFVEEAVPEGQAGNRGEGARVDGVLRLRTPTHTYRLLYELKRTNLGYPIADGVIARAENDPERGLILFAPYIPGPMGEHLAAAGVNYVDEAGNCRLELGKEHVAHIEGRKRPRGNTETRAAGPATVDVMFALLADGDLADAPVRDIAERLGIGKTAVANAIRGLVRQGLITKEKPRRILRPRELLDRWLIGYETIVRPKRLVGRYQTMDAAPEELERRVEDVLGGADTRWGWTGGAAAMRLTGFYRGPDTMLAVEELPQDFFRDLRALRARDGNFAVLKLEGDLAFRGALEHTLHPLLVFAELGIAGDERAREAAAEIRNQYLEDLA